MLPTTRAKTSKATQIQHKKEANELRNMQKLQMLNTVNEAVFQYSASTGKQEKSARQELFTMERLSHRKRTLCARDIFIRDKMQEINKGMCSYSIRILLGYPLADLCQTSPKESVSTL